MNIVDIIIIVILVLCTLLGLKKGAIKSLVQLLGTVAVLILAYTFKGVLANFLMSFMPFFNFIGYVGITSINVLVYELISFIVIFVVFYCILNILLSLSGLVESLLKLNVILAVPSRIFGALLGFLDGVMIAFLMSFIMLHLGPTEKLIMNSNMGIIVLERTPFVGTVLARTTLAMEEINALVNNMTENTNLDSVNAQALQVLIHYQIISKEDAQKLIEDKKVDLENVTFALN